MAASRSTELLRQALAAARTGDKTRTRELLQEVTRLDPRNDTAWQWLAGVAATPLEAVAALERAVAINPHNDGAKVALREVRLEAGVAAAKGKDIPNARRLLRAAVADDPDSELGWLWLAAVCDSPSEALSHLNRVLALNPNNTAAKKGIEYYQAKLKKAAAGQSSGVSTSGVVRAIDETPVPPDVAGPGSGIGPAAGPASGVGLGAKPGSGPVAASRKILVVDESRTIRKLVAMTAGAEGFRVVEAADATEAAGRILEDGPPELILLDATLPGVDGYEFCKLVRNNPSTKAVPVVLMTGKDGLFDKLRGAVAGVNGALHKPLDPDELMTTVRSYLSPDPVPTS